MSDKNRCSTLLVGAGEIGRRVAISLNNDGHGVTSVSRSAHEMPNGIPVIAANLVTGEGLSKLPSKLDALVFCVAPDERTASAYRRLYVEGLQRVMEHCQTERLIFISSTAVYGQDAGEWIDETSPANAETFNGQILREAEAVCGQHHKASVLRFSGIYGPGRTWMLNRARAGESGRAHWTNRIHIEDGVTAITHILKQQSASKIYCVSDDCPALESDLFTWLRDPEAKSEPLAIGDATGRRINNHLLRSTNWQPTFPSYREGYRQLLLPAGV